MDVNDTKINAAEQNGSALGEAAANAPSDGAQKAKKPRSRYYNDGLDALKFWLMPFVCFATFGFQFKHGEYIGYLCMFAPAAFYILCGFASAAAEKVEVYPYSRTLRRTAISFLVVAGVILAINLIYYAVYGQFDRLFAHLIRKKTIFNFTVLCIWPSLSPIGETLWFLQSLLYARIVLWFMNKRNLMRRYKVVMIVCFLLMVVFGELAGVIGFRIYTYTYIPATTVVMALAYMFLGRLIFENKEKLFSLPSFAYIALFLIGGAAAVGEIKLLQITDNLVYTGHMIGYGVMAFSVCCLFMKKEKFRFGFAVAHGRNYSRRIYALSQSVIYIMLIILTRINKEWYFWLREYAAAPVIYLICLFFAYEIGYWDFRRSMSEGRV